VDDDVARPITDSRHLDLNGEIRAAAEETGQPLLEQAVTQHDTIFPRRGDALAPAQKIRDGRGESPLRMDRLIRPALRDQLGDGPRVVQEVIAHGAEIVLVPGRFDGLESAGRLGREGARGVLVETALVPFATGLEMKRVARGIISCRLDVAFFKPGEVRTAALADVPFHS